jgi:hypothetical protein
MLTTVDAGTVLEMKRVVVLIWFSPILVGPSLATWF